MALKYVQTNTLYQAGSGNIIGASSIVLTSFADIYGNVLTMTDFGAKGYITLEPDTTNEEAATFTGIVANANGTYTLTGISTVLAKSPYTETSGLVRQHSGGTKLVITDNVAFWNTFGNKANDETLTGRWSTAVVPVSGPDLANKTYVDGVAVSGAPNADTTTKGIVQKATQAQSQAATDVGSTGASLFLPNSAYGARFFSGYAADAGANDTYVITLSPVPTAYFTGQIVSFKANTANTGACSLNVNGLGAIALKLNGADPQDNTISAGAYLVVQYDGTNFNILSNSSTFGTTASKVVQLDTVGKLPAVDGSQLTNLISTSLTASENISIRDAVAIGAAGNTPYTPSTGHATIFAMNTTAVWKSQSFVTSAVAVSISSLTFWCTDNADGDIVTASIRADSAGQPTGADISGTTGTVSIGNASTVQKTITFGTPITVSPSTTYHFVFRSNATGPSASLAGNNLGGQGTNTSANSGTTWSANNGALEITYNEIDTVAGQVARTTAATVARDRNSGYIGFATAGISTSAQGVIQHTGVVTGFSGLTPGAQYYLSNTLGAISTSAGTVSRKIGRALSSTALLIVNDNA